MIEAPSSNDDYQKNLNRINRYARFKNNMPFPNNSATLMQMVREAILEGMIMLQAEEKEKLNPKAIEPDPRVETNPFIRARIQILSKKSEFCRKELLQMEKDNNVDNRIYNAFAKEIRILGEIFEKK